MKEKSNNKPKKKRPEPDLEITELFGVKNGKNDFSVFYTGVIIREYDESGKEIAVNGKVKIDGSGMIWSRDTDQTNYGDNLDNIVELRIDYGIHKDPGVFSEIAENIFFHN
jgi:hypothetical protein